MRLSLRIASAVCAIATSVTSVAAAGVIPFRKEPFTDVPRTHANSEAIEYLRENNILRGYPDGTFKPDNGIVRAEFVSIITNPFFLSARSNDCLKDNYSVSNNPGTPIFYPDVRRDSWYAQHVCEATVHGFVNGYADGTFKPNHYINFVEAAKVATRLFSLDVKAGEPGDPKWYVAYVQRLSELRAIPSTIKTFPQEITRGEMAEIVFRLKTNNTGKASANYENIR